MRISKPAALGVGICTTAMYSITAIAPPGADAAPPTSVRSTTTAEVLHLDTLHATGQPAVADAGIAVSTGVVDGSASPRSKGVARNLDAALAGQALPDLISVARQTAPPGHGQGVSRTTLPGRVPGVLGLDVSRASAQALWAGDDACLSPGTPLTTSSVSTSDVSLLPASPAGTAVALPGTVSTRQSSRLVPNDAGASRGMVATASGSAADLRLFGGQLRVAVTDAPTLQATATGSPGGAHVAWNAPAVTVSVQGEEQTLPADGSPVDFTSPDNPLLTAELSVGQAEDVVEQGDGTTASARASVLHVLLRLGSGSTAATLLDADLFPLSASASVPDGGVDCGTAQDSDGDGLTDGDEAGLGTNAADPDTDGDGLSDGAEVSGAPNDGYGNAPTDPTEADTDGDGLGDGHEVDQTGTDPSDADTDDGGVDDGTEVDQGTDPLDASDDSPATAGDADGDGLENSDEVQQGTNPVDPDSDGDHLEDGTEVDQTGTDPSDADSDNDGLEDGREVKHVRSDPRDKDTDDDGLEDGREVKHIGTDATDKDTDNDGLGDGREVKHFRTNPKRKDTDRDGLTDKEEVTGSANTRYDRCATNPRRADTDRDGLKDGEEIHRYGTNPCDRDTDNGGQSDGKEVRHGSDPLDPHSWPKHPRAGTGFRLSA